MLNQSLAIRYAQALFALAAKGQGYDAQLVELIRVKGILDSSPPLKKAVESPTIPGSTKKAILKQLLEKRTTATTLHFLFVLVDKNREVYVDSILEAYRDLLRNQRGEVAAALQTATALAPTVLAQVQTTLLKHTGKKVDLKTEVVPSLIGGMVIHIGDKVIDGSIRRQLLQIQERLSKVSAATVGG